MIRGVQPAADAAAVDYSLLSASGALHPEPGATVIVKEQTGGHSGELDLGLVLKSDFFFVPCSDSYPGLSLPTLPPSCAAVSAPLCIPFAAEPESLLPSLLLCLAVPLGWLTGWQADQHC